MPPADRSPSSRPSAADRGGSRAPRSDQDPNAYSAGLWKVAGLGMTLTSEVIGGAILGLGLDYLFGTSPILLVVFTLLGLGVAMSSFIRSALGVSGQAGRDARAAVAAGRAAPLEDEPEEPEPAEPADDGFVEPEPDATAALEAELRAELESLAESLRPEADEARASDRGDEEDEAAHDGSRGGRTGKPGEPRRPSGASGPRDDDPDAPDDEPHRR